MSRSFGIRWRHPRSTNRKPDMEATTCQERSKELHLKQDFLVQESVQQKAAGRMMHDVGFV